ncbi:MAG: T9SS type A sorting domain-containing protein, partial [bacterium]|nr:T9SS type A sorting domain-containing protein [bacterium]
DPFPLAQGDTVSEINSLAVTSLDFSQDLLLYAGVTMSGGYAGVYAGDILYNQYGIYQITNWTYLGGPGNPADNPPTSTCTDIYALDGYSDHLLCATGDSGVISYYDGSGFTHAFVGNDETTYEISLLDPISPAIMALTGPHGNIYTGYLLYPYDANFWVHEPDPPEENPVALDSDDIYDHFVFGNYHYYAGGSPAMIYRQGGESDIEPTVDLPSDFGGVPTAVYSLGHVGNLVLAGTGDYGVLYGTRDNGKRWAPAKTKSRDGTRIVTMLDLGSTYPLLLLAGADGDNGGLYVFAAPNYAFLESPKLIINYKDTHFDRATWDVDLNDGNVIVQVRTFNNSDASDATPWLVQDPDDPEGVIPNPDAVIENGHSMEAIPSVHRGDRYLQYQVILISSLTGESPIFKEIRLGYGSLGYDSLLPEDHIHAIPNPITTNVCTIHYALAADATVTAGVYDIKGRLVWSESEEGIGLKPNQFIDWDTSGVAPGVYLYRVNAETPGGDSDTVVKKLAVLK